MTAKGFTLLEVIIAFSVTLFIIIAVMTMHQQAQRMMEVTDQELSLRSEFETQFMDLSNTLSNAVRMNPAEDYEAPEDHGYQGILGMKNSRSDLPCHYEFQNLMNQESASIIRFTGIEKRHRPMVLLAAWSEDFVDATIDMNSASTQWQKQLRLSEIPGQSLTVGEELVLVDSDGLLVRRYKIAKANLEVSSRHPYLNTIVPGQTYRYWIVDLDMPLNAVGGSMAKKSNLNFISKSVAYVAKTEFICLAPDKKSILRLSEQNLSAPVTALAVSSSWIQLQSFQIQFLNTQNSTLNVRPDQFKTFRSLSASQKECINMALLSLNFSVKKESAEKALRTMRYHFFLSNHHQFRPQGCL